MEHALITIEPKSTALSNELAASSRLAADFIKASRSPNTLDAYVSDWRIFAEWCGVRKLETLPPTPNTLCMFLADEASRGRRPSTLQRRLAAIKYALEAAGVLSDTERSPTSHKSVSALATLRGPPAPLWLAVLPLTNRNFLRPMRAKPSRGSLRLSVGSSFYFSSFGGSSALGAIPADGRVCALSASSSRAGCPLVACPRAGDLLFRAKHLFVAAMATIGKTQADSCRISLADA
jgi:hypothetical protein